MLTPGSISGSASPLVQGFRISWHENPGVPCGRNRGHPAGYPDAGSVHCGKKAELETDTLRLAISTSRALLVVCFVVRLGERGFQDACMDVLLLLFFVLSTPSDKQFSVFARV